VSDVHAPTPEQAAAIAARDRDVLCEAGAGTGKTRVLVDRYCEAVDADGLGTETVLAFTFTERAAAELRARVRGELSVRAAAARDGGDGERATRLGRAARETERAWVTTIHGFCRRLLASHPVAAGIDPRFRVLDDAEASRLRRRARDAALADVLAAGAPVEVIAGYRPERFGDMAVMAHERLRSQGMTEPKLPPAPDPVRSVKDPAKEEVALSAAEREAAERARETLAEVMAAFHGHYEELKASRSGLDFADLELRALDLLRSSPAVAETWRGRFEHVMVDEFQDTNRVQLELVEALRGPSTRVFRVGDEFQSIYRFRNADLAVFRDERTRAEEDPATDTLPLTGNFRSRPEVLGTVNAIGEALLGPGFSHLASARNPEGGAPAAELLLTLDEGRGDGARKWSDHTEALEPPRSETQAHVVAEARNLARRLRELVDSGEAARGDIVVLLRAFTHVDAYEEALGRVGLDPYVVGGRGYWSQQQVEDMLRLLSTIANPLDDEMLLGALASPACDASPDALWLLRRAATEGRHMWPTLEWRFGGSDRRPDPLEEAWLEEIPGTDAAKLERFCGTLAQLRAAAPLLPLDALVDATMTASDYDLALLAREAGRGRMANVRKLMRLAREFEAHEGRDLRGFLGAAEELAERDEREGLAAVQAEEHDGARVMTVHAAKGLEFRVVAVPDLGRALSAGERWEDVVLGRLSANGDGPPQARFGMRLAMPASKSFGVWELVELSREGMREAAEEGCRLVYVAATRAKDRLILSGTFKPSQWEDADDAKPGDSALRRLLPALRKAGWDPERSEGELELPSPQPAAGATPLATPALLAIRTSVPSADRAAQLAEPIAAPAPAASEAPEGSPPLARPPAGVPVGQLSYSALAEYERCAYRFYVERTLGLSAPPSPHHPESQDGGSVDTADGTPLGAPAVPARHLGFGNAVHAALEWSARNAFQAPSDELLLALLADEGVASDPELLERARGMIEGWLASELHAELASSRIRPEVPFAIPLAGAIVRGQIDLLAAGSPPTVLDYKTDALGSEGPSALAERYVAQRELYALAVAGASNGNGRPSKVRAIHLFLEAPGEPVIETYDAARLVAARHRLEGLIDEIRAGGSFAPTERPSWPVCNGCPAAARLCPHPAWHPGG
jgi:ATP-dependent helicase/nuclease subunit A